MDQINVSISSLIEKRRSVRTYADMEIEEDILQAVREILAIPQKTPFGNQDEFQLVRTGNDPQGRKTRLGTYGFIRGAKWFVAGKTKPASGYLFDYGYQLESVILQLTRLGLGTCWLGGTFSRSGFRKVLSLDEGMEVPAVTPIGYPSQRLGVHERLIRRISTADRRKPMEEIFCRNSLKTGDSSLQRAMEGVRLAPSAENAQPWRIQRSGPYYHFYLRRSTGLSGGNLMQTLQEIDMGIAMAHWELVLSEEKVSGEWITVESKEWEQPEDLEYILSWKLDKSYL